MLKEQRPFKFFNVPTAHMKEFVKEAKKHGLLYVPIRNKRKASHIEIVVFADDASKIQRIYDNLGLDFVRAQAGEANVEKEPIIENAISTVPAPSKAETVHSEQSTTELKADEKSTENTYDWAEFNKERQYLQRQVEWSSYVDWVAAQDLELPVEDPESLLDSIEDMELLKILSKEDKLTIQIAFLKMSGYNGYEIAEKTGLTQKAVNLRMVRLRKKLKFFLKHEAIRPFSWAIGRTGKSVHL